MTPEAGPGYKVHVVSSKTGQRVLQAETSGFLVAIASEQRPGATEPYWAISYQGTAADPAGSPLGRVFTVRTESDARNAMGLLAGLYVLAHGN
jgi:hypothetical protein